MHSFVSAVLVQTVKATTTNVEPMYMTLGNKFKVLSAQLAKLSIWFTIGAAQIDWCNVVLELSVPVILGMDWLTQINPKIYWSEKTIETSNDTKFFWKLVVWVECMKMLAS